MPLAALAARRAASLTMPARAQLTRVAPGFMSPSSFSLTQPRVSAFSGMCSVTTSLSRKIVSRSQLWMPSWAARSTGTSGS